MVRRMTDHSHCPNCSALIIVCTPCDQSFLVEALPGQEAVNGSLLAQSAAVWHIFEEHPADWAEVIGDRPPVDERLARLTTS